MGIVKIKKVSKSLVHTYNGWVEQEECGSVLKSKYVDRTWKDEWYDSPPMKLGKYFECQLYKALGVLPKDMPEYPALYNVSGTEMLEAYKKAFIKAPRIAILMVASGIRVVECQTYIKKDINGITFHGYLDLKCIYKGRRIVIDIKYSGLLYNKWEKMGWVFNSEEQKSYHGVQAKHYKAITGLEFYYLVVSPTNPIDVEFFEVVISKYAMEQHTKKVLHIARNMEMLQEFDQMAEKDQDSEFIDYPDYVKCERCPLQKHMMCKNALRILEPKQIEISS